MSSPDIRELLEDLTVDAVHTIRAMLDHGDTDTRIKVINQVLPQVKKLLDETSGGAGNPDVDRRNEAREIIAQMWAPFGPKDKAQ